MPNDALNVAMVLAHLLVVAAALGWRSALDVLAHQYINLFVFSLNLRGRKQCFVGPQKVHVGDVLLKPPKRDRKSVLFAPWSTLSCFNLGTMSQGDLQFFSWEGMRRTFLGLGVRFFTRDSISFWIGRRHEMLSLRVFKHNHYSEIIMLLGSQQVKRAVAVGWEFSEDKMDRIVKVKLSDVRNSSSLLFDLKGKVCLRSIPQPNRYC